MESHIKSAKQRMRRVVTRTAGPTAWNILNKHALLIFRISSVVIYYIIGAAYYHAKEGWSVIDSVYFVTVSVATIGYGYLVPTSDASRVFTAFFVIAGLIFVLTAADDFAVHVVVRFQNFIINSWYPRITDLDRAAKKLSMTFACLVGLSFLCMIFFITNENWSGASAFYWTVSTMTTVGYGDLNLKYDSTRIFSIFFIAFCVISYATVIHNIQEVYAAAIQPAQQQHIIEVPSLASRFRERRPHFDSGIDPERMCVSTINPLVELSSIKYRRAEQGSGHYSSNIDDEHEDASNMNHVEAIQEQQEIKTDLEANFTSTRSPQQQRNSNDIIMVQSVLPNLEQDGVIESSNDNTAVKSLRRYYSLRGNTRADAFSPIRTLSKSRLSPISIEQDSGMSMASDRSLLRSHSYISPRKHNAGICFNDRIKSESKVLRGGSHTNNDSVDANGKIDCTIMVLSILEQLYEGGSFSSKISQLKDNYINTVPPVDRLQLPFEEFIHLLTEYHLSKSKKISTSSKEVDLLQLNQSSEDIGSIHAEPILDVNEVAATSGVNDDGSIKLLSNSFDIAQQLDNFRNQPSSQLRDIPDDVIGRNDRSIRNPQLKTTQSSDPIGSSSILPIDTIKVNSIADSFIDDLEYETIEFPQSKF